MGGKSKSVGITLGADLYSRLKVEAERGDRPLAYIVRKAVAEYLRKRGR